MNTRTHSLLRPHAELVSHIPAFAQRVQVVGTAVDEVVEALDTRVVCSTDGPRLDAIVAVNPSPPADNTGTEAWTPLLPHLAEDGYVLILAPNGEYWRGNPAGVTPEGIRARLETSGLVLYTQVRVPDRVYARSQPNANGLLELGRKSFAIGSEDERLRLLTTHYLFIAVRPSYNPVVHACALCEAGQPEWAYEVLSLIPPVYLEDEQVYASVGAEKMACLLRIASVFNDNQSLSRFWLSQSLFYQVIARVPQTHFAYQCHAEFWRRLGNVDMASRLLRSILRVAPDEPTRAQLAQYERITCPRPTGETSIEWDPVRGPARVLMITHPRPHYGLDVLYDGLCRVLGADSVIEYPYKPFLHGTVPQDLAHYPCTFNWPGHALSLDEILRRLRERVFDVVLFADIEQSMDAAAAQRIMQAAADTPVFIVDARDECDNPREITVRHLGVGSVAGFFKREMLAGVDYGPNAFPLPFGYPEDRIPHDIDGSRPIDFFWAGHRSFGMRRLYLERLEATLRRDLNQVYSQDEYVRLLHRSRIGINLFGLGFDTVRYWEIPAHGAMLLAERLPIRIPHDFEDGVSAVFFDDLEDLEDRLAYYVEHEAESLAIARAGHAHLRLHHTGSARARQLLGHIQHALGT